MRLCFLTSLSESMFWQGLTGHSLICHQCFQMVWYLHTCTLPLQLVAFQFCHRLPWVKLKVIPSSLVKHMTAAFQQPRLMSWAVMFWWRTSSLAISTTVTSVCICCPALLAITFLSTCHMNQENFHILLLNHYPPFPPTHTPITRIHSFYHFSFDIIEIIVL